NEAAAEATACCERGSAPFATALRARWKALRSVFFWQGFPRLRSGQGSPALPPRAAPVHTRRMVETEPSMCGGRRVLRPYNGDFQSRGIPSLRGGLLYLRKCLRRNSVTIFCR